MVDRVAVVGSGLVGSGWTVVFARAGFEVAVWDAEGGKAEAARDRLADDLPGLAAQGLLGDAGPADVLARIRAADSLADAVAGAVHVQECAPERLEVKREVFAALDAAAEPGTVLASSTSGIVASAFSEDVGGRARCLVAHPLNPPHLIPLVEIVPAPWTSEDAVRRTGDLMARAGQVPVLLRKEVPGFVVNRLQGALLQEAFRLVEDGVTDADGVDAAVADGLGLRWAFMGPFETIDLNAPGGIADYVARYGGLYHELAVDAGPPRKWGQGLAAELEKARRRRLPADALGRRSAWRDRRLAALVAHKRGADPGDAT